MSGVTFGPGIEVLYLDHLAHLGRYFQGKRRTGEDLGMRYRGVEYGVDIEEVPQEYASEVKGGAWSLGIAARRDTYSPHDPVLGVGEEYFDTIEAAILSAMLTIIVRHDEPWGEWEAVRLSEE